MNYVPIPVAMLELGKPLPVDVWAPDGRLLLRKGQVILSAQHKEMLNTHQASMTESDAKAWQKSYERMIQTMLRDGADLADGERGHVGGETHGFSVEIAARQGLVGLVSLAGEDQRIVRDAIGLIGQGEGGLAEDVEGRAHHLGLAAQAIGILHPGIAGQVRCANRRAPHQLAQRRRRRRGHLCGVVVRDRLSIQALIGKLAHDSINRLPSCGDRQPLSG